MCLWWTCRKDGIGVRAERSCHYDLAQLEAPREMLSSLLSRQRPSGPCRIIADQEAKRL